jgi:hypothetical protein
LLAAISAAENIDVNSPGCESVAGFDAAGVFAIEATSCLILSTSPGWKNCVNSPGPSLDPAPAGAFTGEAGVPEELESAAANDGEAGVAGASAFGAAVSGDFGVGEAGGNESLGAPGVANSIVNSPGLSSPPAGAFGFSGNAGGADEGSRMTGISLVET